MIPTDVPVERPDLELADVVSHWIANTTSRRIQNGTMAVPKWEFGMTLRVTSEIRSFAKPLTSHTSSAGGDIDFEPSSLKKNRISKRIAKWG